MDHSYEINTFMLNAQTKNSFTKVSKLGTCIIFCLQFVAFMP